MGDKGTCSAADCPRPAIKLGMCGMHYQRDKKTRARCRYDRCTLPSVESGWCGQHDRWVTSRGYTPERMDLAAETCDIADCGDPPHCFGWCNKHSARYLRHGDPLVALRDWSPADERVFGRVAFGEQRYDGTRCLEWQSTRAPSGYGMVTVQGKTHQVHRWMYERWVGPIPAGYHVDHLCMNKVCCNTAHLEAVTPRENTRRYLQSIGKA